MDIWVDVFLFINLLARTLELLGVLIILVAIVIAMVTFLRDGRRTKDWPSAYRHCRHTIGRGILLGLELLVAGDIISTTTSQLTFESVGSLAAIVVIRSFLSLSLRTEIEGRLPWQRAIKESERSEPTC